MIDLDELERLCREATPGPWTYDGSEERVNLASIDGCGCCGSPWIDAADGHLIAALRNNADELIAMARRYQWLRDAKSWPPNLAGEPDLDAAIDAAMQEQER